MARSLSTCAKCGRSSSLAIDMMECDAPIPVTVEANFLSDLDFGMNSLRRITTQGKTSNGHGRSDGPVSKNRYLRKTIWTFCSLRRAGRGRINRQRSVFAESRFQAFDGAILRLAREAANADGADHLAVNNDRYAAWDLE